MSYIYTQNNPVQQVSQQANLHSGNNAHKPQNANNNLSINNSQIFQLILSLIVQLLQTLLKKQSCDCSQSASNKGASTGDSRGDEGKSQNQGAETGAQNSMSSADTARQGLVGSSASGYPVDFVGASVGDPSGIDTTTTDPQGTTGATGAAGSSGVNGQSTSAPAPTGTAQGGPYSQSLSNLEDNGGIQMEDDNRETIDPDPQGTTGATGAAGSSGANGQSTSASAPTAQGGPYSQSLSNLEDNGGIYASEEETGARANDQSKAQGSQGAVAASGYPVDFVGASVGDPSGIDTTTTTTDPQGTTGATGAAGSSGANGQSISASAPTGTAQGGPYSQSLSNLEDNGGIQMEDDNRETIDPDPQGTTGATGAAGSSGANGQPDSIPAPTGTAQGGPYSQSLSNLEDNGGIQMEDDNRETIDPDPQGTTGTTGAAGPTGTPGDDSGISGDPGDRGEEPVATVFEYIGTDAEDTINGRITARNIIEGKKGNDDISGDRLVAPFQGGGALNDVIFGDEGSDKIDGWLGDDRLFGNDGNDFIDGGNGNDFIDGGRGIDTLNGEDDNDRIEGNEGDDLIDGGKGVDTIYGGIGADSVWAGPNNDVIYGEVGDDKVLDGQEGDDDVYGGEGNDNLYGGTGIDELFGGSGDDTLEGQDDEDDLYGNSGDDKLFGGNARDYLSAGLGDDELDGGEGNDDLFGGNGNDKLFGNIGNDFLYGGESTGQHYTDDVEVLTGGKGNDVLVSSLGDSVVNGGDNNDEIYVQEGHHVIIDPGAGTDVIYTRGVLSKGSDYDKFDRSNLPQDAPFLQEGFVRYKGTGNEGSNTSVNTIIDIFEGNHNGNLSYTDLPEELTKGREGKEGKEGDEGVA